MSTAQNTAHTHTHIHTRRSEQIFAFCPFSNPKWNASASFPSITFHSCVWPTPKRHVIDEQMQWEPEQYAKCPSNVCSPSHAAFGICLPCRVCVCVHCAMHSIQFKLIKCLPLLSSRLWFSFFRIFPFLIRSFSCVGRWVVCHAPPYSGVKSYAKTHTRRPTNGTKKCFLFAIEHNQASS